MLEMKEKFSEAHAKSLSLQQEGGAEIEDQVFSQILDPIKDILDHDAVYMHYETGLYHQMRELRQMCVEVQVMQTISDPVRRQERSTLLNILQGLLESIEVSQNGLIIVDKEDLFDLSRLTNIIRENAIIYREFLHNPNVADALDSVANNIEATQSLTHTFDNNFNSTHQSFDCVSA